MTSAFYDLARSVDLRAPYLGVLALVVAGALGIFLGWRTYRAVRPKTALILLVCTGLLTFLTALYTNLIWRPVADGIAIPVWVWAGFALTATALTLTLLVRRWRSADGKGRVGRLLASLALIVLTALTTATGVNSFYGAYPNLASALGMSIQTSTLQELGATAPSTAFDPGGKSLADTWQAPADMPQTGQVAVQNIPANDPAFTPRDAYIYLPPAYFSAQRPLLPVIVLMAGQPGSPGDWFNMGALDETMNSFATEHRGLAPVVVVVDPLGGDWSNPLCSDTDRGQVATYLQETVPAWVGQNLQVSTDHRQWAIGGLSNGGTCALQVVTRAPEIYPTFFDMSGEGHPSLGTEELTIAKGFAGDSQAYQANDPLTLLGQQDYRDEQVAGIFGIGTGDDPVYSQKLRSLYEAAQKAGMDVQWWEYDGKHEWKVWSATFTDALPWFATRTGLTK